MSMGDWLALLLLTGVNLALLRKTAAICRQIKTSEPRCTYDEWKAGR